MWIILLLLLALLLGGVGLAVQALRFLLIVGLVCLLASGALGLFRRNHHH